MFTSNRILVVEDEADLSDIIAFNLKRAGHTPIQAGDGAQGLTLARRERPDLLILDLMLPKMDGLEVARRLRDEPTTASIPIIMLTARAEERDQLAGLAIGADDYITKPFEFEELLARIRALLRRQSSSAEAPQRMDLGELHLDAGNRSVRLRGVDIELTGAEFDLLWALAANAGHPMSRDELSETTRGTPYDGLDRTIDLRIASLRAKLGDTSKPPAVILSIRGVGYQLATSGTQ